MKDLPILFNGQMVRAILDGRKTQTRRPRMGGEPPRYQVGDRLYVRESYAPHYHGPGRHGYAADWTERAADTVPRPRWTPSIHMPRAAARIWLEVVGVRAERVGDITLADCIAEGVESLVEAGQPDVGRNPADRTYEQIVRGRFRRIWIDIYGEQSWGLGYCWVYAFRRIEVTP